MEFSLINAGLAAGAALAALPVILHLFMRQTPKHVIFPALRLVRERQKRSKKRLRVKNWLLLLARMAVLALMALALARPRLYSQMPLGDESVPTALGLVFDTSLSMGYKENDKTRLDEAKERAREIIDKIPDSSLVFRRQLGRSGRAQWTVAGRGPQVDRQPEHPSREPAAQRRDGPGLPDGRRVRSAPARGLRSDRPVQLFLDPRSARRGSRQGCQGQDDPRQQDCHFHRAPRFARRDRRGDRRGRARQEFHHPGRIGRGQGHDSCPGSQAGQSSRRVLSRWREEG